MRTTLTIDDDLAAVLERLRRSRDTSFRDIVNEALRRGLKDMTARPKPREPFRTKSFDAGTPLVPSLDNVTEVLAIAESENFK